MATGQRETGGTRGRGQALLELTLVLPLVFILFAGALDLGRVWYAVQGTESAAREGAIEASSNVGSFVAGTPCNTTTNRVMCRVVNEAAGSLVTVVPADVSLACSPSPCPTVPTWGNTVTVTVTGRLDLVTPFLSALVGATQTFHSSVTAQLAVSP
jgi:uncharacterized membrane protein